MRRPRFITVTIPILVLALAGCDSGRAERAQAEAESLRAHDELRRTQGEVECLKEENARLHRELDDARKLLGRDAAQDDWLEQTGDFAAVTSTGTFVISYRRA